MFLLTFVSGVFVGAMLQWRMAKHRNSWLKSQLQMAVCHADNLVGANKQLINEIKELKTDLYQVKMGIVDNATSPAGVGAADAFRYIKNGIRI